MCDIFYSSYMKPYIQQNALKKTPHGISPFILLYSAAFSLLDPRPVSVNCITVRCCGIAEHHCFCGFFHLTEVIPAVQTIPCQVCPSACRPYTVRALEPPALFGQDPFAAFRSISGCHNTSSAGAASGRGGRSVRFIIFFIVLTVVRFDVAIMLKVPSLLIFTLIVPFSISASYSSAPSTLITALLEVPSQSVTYWIVIWSSTNSSAFTPAAAIPPITSVSDSITKLSAPYTVVYSSSNFIGRIDPVEHAKRAKY